MPSRGGHPIAMITQPAAVATSTAAMRPHMSAARSRLAKIQASKVGTATVKNVITQRTQPSRHQGIEAAAGAALERTSAACANSRRERLWFMRISFRDQWSGLSG